MGKFIDINNREQLAGLFRALDAGDKPLWGKMTPQEMVEHLLEQIEYTNGKQIFISDISPEESHRLKQENVYSDAEMPKNVILGPLPPARFNSLQPAVNRLIMEMDGFDRHFTQPGVTCDHAFFGPMNHGEWLLWHGKHFTHHLKQFGLFK